LAGSQLSTVQPLASSQPTWLTQLQAPALHTSPLVQALPSLQGRLLTALAQPLLGSQLSVVHGLASLHAAASPGAQAPPLHTSPAVQALPSLQLAALGNDTQPPLLSQLSAVHGLPSSHPTGLPLHAPSLQMSPLVQALPSSQAPVLGGCWHSPPMQLS
jgi:hypothetical protein